MRMNRKTFLGISLFLFPSACRGAATNTISQNRPHHRTGIAVGPVGSKNFNDRFQSQLNLPVIQASFIELVSELGLSWSLERMTEEWLGPRPYYIYDAFNQSELDATITIIAPKNHRRQNYLEAYRAFIIAGKVVLIENHFSRLMSFP
jgi:hypothetical protein